MVDIYKDFSNYKKVLEEFDLEKSDLLDNQKVIFRYLINYINKNGDISLSLRPIQIILYYIYNNKGNFFSCFEKVPLKLVEDTFGELGNQEEFNFVRKFYSLFSEIQSYIKLNEEFGFSFHDSIREDSTCDLVLNKVDKLYYFEVKSKADYQALYELVEFFLRGISHLSEYSFLREKEIKVTIKVDNIVDSTYKLVYDSLVDFIKNKDINFENEFIKVEFRRELSNGLISVKCSTSCSISYFPEEELEEIIKSIFFRDKGQIDKIIKKSKKFENFNGLIVWDTPWYWDFTEDKDIKIDKIKKAFEKLLKEKKEQIDFNIYLYINGFKVDNLIKLENIC